MSLINDALKKAQRQRGDESPAEALPAAGPARAVRTRPADGSPLILRLGVGVVALCAVIVTVVVLVRRDPAAPVTVASTPAPATAASPAPTPAPAPAPAVATPAPEPLPAPAPAIISLTPAPAPGSQTPATPAAPVALGTPAPDPVGPSLLPNLSQPAAAPAPLAALTLADQDPRILTYLDALRVTAIRPAGEDTKVLMNDRVFRLNDIVDRSLGLRLTGAANRRLDFRDERGVDYVKTF